MLSRRPLYLLSLLALFLTLTQANRPADAVVFARAKDNADTVATTQPPSTSQSSSVTTQKPTTSPSLTPATTTTPPSTTPTSPSTSSPTSATLNTVSTSSTAALTTTQPSVTPAKSSVTVLVTQGGSVSSVVTDASSQTTSSSKSGSTASAQDSAGSQTGISTKTKNTIIGVVVGVAGAIVLAGLSIVAWRIWGRKRKTEESDGLMGYSNAGGAGQQEKTGSMTATGASPFQSTLENYHNPTKNVNASSNF